MNVSLQKRHEDARRTEFFLNRVCVARNATIVVVPSTALESLQLGSIVGITALTKESEQQQAAEISRKIVGPKKSAA